MTDSTTFARRLMRIREKSSQRDTLSPIMGSVAITDLPAFSAYYRIGLWPCISAEKPEFAMGLWVLLAHYLERWRGVRVYRLLVKLEGEPEDFDWSIEQSQFEVDDYPVESLDENIAIWGTLNKTEDKWQLKVFIENDLLTGEDNEPAELDFNADLITDFVAQLPKIALSILQTLESSIVDDTEALTFTVDNLPDEAKLTALFSNLLEWDVQLLASLSGVEIEDADIESDFDALLEAGKAANHDVAAWAIANAVAHTMLPGYSVFGDLFVERVDEIVEAFPASYLPAPMLATAIYQMGQIQDAYDLLEGEIETHSDSAMARLKLAQLYGQSGRLADTVACLQDAISANVTNNYLYRAYGNVLQVVEQRGEIMDEFVLIDADEIDEDQTLWEAIAAYDAALKITPSDTRALYNQLLLLLMVESEEQRIWDTFKRLLQLDGAGEYIRDVIENMYDLDIKPGINAIEAMIKAQGERIDLFINLAALHLAQEAGDEAKPYLEKAKAMTDVTEKLAEIERLLLVADDSEFEQRFGELEAVINAGNSLDADDVEFLENASESAPHLIDAHLLLAGAYYAWEDNDAALEVLLDTQEKIPNNPAVIDMLAKILWEAGEEKLAFEYLNKGLAAYPFSVPLLTRTGQFLFDNGQLADARTYLGRAEEIAPQHPALQLVRAYIVSKIAENPGLYKED
jgi:tetratricopeptide (TPR) repeat protein